MSNDSAKAFKLSVPDLELSKAFVKDLFSEMKEAIFQKSSAAV